MTEARYEWRVFDTWLRSTTNHAEAKLNELEAEGYEIIPEMCKVFIGEGDSEASMAIVARRRLTRSTLEEEELARLLAQEAAVSGG